MSIIRIETERFLLRPLTVEDATDRYLGWFSTPAAGWIASASAMQSRDALRAYIAEREHREDVLFLGIFERPGGRHLGNIKFEPVDSANGYAIFGVFIGEIDQRGIGVAGEILAATADWLKVNRGIRQILLGVDAENIPAIKAYQKAGFEVADTPHIPPSPGSLRMVWNLE